MPSLADTSVDHLERHLALLARQTPKAAVTIRSTPPSPCHIEPDDETDAEAAEAVGAVATSPGPGGMGPPVFVLGPRHPRRLQTILAGRDQASSRQPVVIVEPDVRALRAALSLPGWAPILRADGVRWAVGPDPLAACKHAFDDDDAFWFLNAAFVGGARPVELELTTGVDGHWQAFVRAAAADLKASISALEEQRRAFARHREVRDGPKTLAASDVSVLCVVDRSTTALQHIARDLLEAAARRGHRTRVHLESYEHDPFRTHRRTRAFFESKPDVLLCLVQSGRQTYGDLAGELPTLVYYSSDPDRYDLDHAAFRRQDRVFISDPTWAGRFTRRGVDAMPLPLATAFDREEAARTPLDTADVVMVANLTGEASWARDLSPSAVAEARRVAEALATDPSMDLDAAVASSPLAALETADRAVARRIDAAATDILRRDAVVRLAEAGLPISVYGGEGWRAALAGTAAADAYVRPLDYMTEVPSAYHHARVVVNVGAVGAPEALNMRAFDVPAVGGCLVTDRRPGLERAFVVGREVVAYDRLDELPSLVRGLLDNADRRDAIADAGHARVRRDHTYDARWRTMWATL